MSMKLTGAVKRYEKEITLPNGDTVVDSVINVPGDGTVIDGETIQINFVVPELDGAGTATLEILDEDGIQIYTSGAINEKTTDVANVNRPITPGMKFRITADGAQTADRVLKPVIYYK